MSELCLCARDADDQCAACRLEIQLLIRGFSEIIQRYSIEMGELVDKHMGMCGSCSRQYIDLVSAGILPQIPCSSFKLFATLYTQLKGLSGGLGVEVTPLTDKTFAEICQKNGWGAL